MSEILKDTCIWYRWCTCWADAVGSGHNCPLFGCFSKETYKTKTKKSLMYTTVKPIWLISLKSRRTGWILTRVKDAVTESTISLLSHHQTKEEGKWGEKWWWLMMEQVQNPAAKNTKSKNQADCSSHLPLSFALVWSELHYSCRWKSVSRYHCNHNATIWSGASQHNGF